MAGLKQEECLRKVVSSSVNVAIVCVITGQFHGSRFLIFGGGIVEIILRRPIHINIFICRALP